MEQRHFEKLTDSQLDEKYPTFYGTRMFITEFTRARHLSLSWGGSIYSMPPLHFLKTYFGTVFHLCLVSFPRASSPEPSTYRRNSPSRRPLWMVRCNTASFLWRGVASTSPNHQARGPPLVWCPRLLILYIRTESLDYVWSELLTGLLNKIYVIKTSDLYRLDLDVEIKIEVFLKIQRNTRVWH